MRFVAAINTRIYGRYYAQGSEIDITAWSRKQMLQFLNLGLMQAGEVTAGMLQDAITFTGAGVTVTVDSDGKLVVNIEEVEHALDWLLDVDTAGASNGQALGWDEASALWKPLTVVTEGVEVTLASLSDVDTTGAQDGWTLRYDVATSLWTAAQISTTLAGLEDVDVTGITDGQTILWDQSSGEFVAGTSVGDPGPPGPASWSAPVPWTSTLNAVIGPPATVVSYQGSSYVAVAPSINSPPPSGSWRLIASKGAPGESTDMVTATVLRNGDQDIDQATTTVVLWDTLVEDTGGLVPSLPAGPVVPSDGQYLITGQVGFLIAYEDGGEGFYDVALRYAENLGGFWTTLSHSVARGPIAPTPQPPSAAPGHTVVPFSRVVFLHAGDTVKLEVYQTNGDVTIGSSVWSTELSLTSLRGAPGPQGDPGTSYTDEMARDAIGAALVAGTGITKTVNDAGDTITIAATGGATYTDEQARDAIAGALVAGANMTVTVDDAANTITLASTGGGGGGSGPGLWRGAWSTLSLDATLDLYPVPGGLTVTNIAGTSAGGVAASGTGNPGGTVLRLGSATSGGFSTDLAKAEITVPAGIVKMRVYAAVEGGFWGNAVRILNNGVNVWNTIVPWGWIELTVAAGNVITFENYLTGNGNSGTWYLDRLEWLAPVDPPYSTGEYVTHLNRFWVSDADNNSGVPGTSGWTRWDPAVDTNDIPDLLEVTQDAVAAMITAGSGITKTYNDSLGTLTLDATGGGGGGTGLFRGEWSSLQVITDATLVNAAAVTALGASVSGNTSFTATPGGVAPPGQGTVLGIGNNTALGQLLLTIPTGVTKVRWYAKVDDNFWDTPQEVRYPNTSTIALTKLTTDWYTGELAVTAGSQISWNSQAGGGSWGTWWIATVELLGPNANPYMAGEYVTYAGRLWRSLSDNNSGTPGTAGWIEVPWTIDAADIPDLTETTQDTIGAMVTAAGGSYNDSAGTITLPAGGLDLEGVQDAVAAMTVAGTGITKVYDDTAGTLTLAVGAGVGLDIEAVQDAVGAMVTDTSTVAKVYDDAAGTLKLNATTLRGEWGVAPAGALAVMRQAMIGTQGNIPTSDASCVVSTAPVTGDVLIFKSVTASGGNITGVSGCGATWTQLGSTYSSGGGVNYNDWWIGTNPSTTGAITVTRGAARTGSHRAWLVGGLDMSTAPVITQVTIGGATASSLTGTPVNATGGQMVIQTVFSTSVTTLNHTQTPSSGWTVQALHTNGAFGSVNTAYRAPSEVGATPHNGTIGRADGSNAAFVVENLVLGTPAAAVSGYLENDTVTHEGKVWQCAVSGTSAEPGVDSDWAELRVAGDVTFRGQWAALSLLYSPNVAGTTVPPEMTASPEWVVEATTFSPPVTMARCLVANSTANGVYDLSFVIPPGATQLEVYVIITMGGGGSTISILKNGVVVWGPLFQTTWAHPLIVVAPGDVITYRSTDGYAGSQRVQFGLTEVKGATDPYMTNQWVYYDQHLFVSTADNNGATPGADATWTPKPLAGALTPYVFSDARVPLVTGAGTMKIPNATGRTLTLTGVRVDMAAAPTGAALIVDVNKNGTTVFTTQANRPQVAIGATSATSGAVNVTSWAPGETLTVDIDQVGSTVTGSGLTVTVIAEG